MAKQNKTVTCASCGQRNRIVVGKARGRPKCGRCKAELKLTPKVARPVVIDDRSFEAQVLGSDLPTLVDCWAPWCQPCKQIAPVLDELARDLDGKLRIAKLNTQENQRVPGEYGLRSIPTLLLFRQGELVDRITGARPKEQLLDWLAGHQITAGGVIERPQAVVR